jgi:hypothetical protein
MSDQKTRMLTAIIDLSENGAKELTIDGLMDHLDKHKTLQLSMEDFEMYRISVLARHSLITREMMN